jgi:hypothetical protein
MTAEGADSPAPTSSTTPGSSDLNVKPPPRGSWSGGFVVVGHRGRSAQTMFAARRRSDSAILELTLKGCPRRVPVAFNLVERMKG